jgi:hypothetical protein
MINSKHKFNKNIFNILPLIILISLNINEINLGKTKFSLYIMKLNDYLYLSELTEINSTIFD